MGVLPTIQDIQTQFRLGTLSCIEYVADNLERIQSPKGEGPKAFIEVYDEQSLKLGLLATQLFEAGIPTPPLLGVTLSIKDLFDVEGQPTRAGSVVLQEEQPAATSATIVDRLLRAGAILIGRTNMTEFAYSGVGLNPHYGTPASPFDRETRRIPGGSSSGSGVSVADQMAVASIGTDTGGSVRIPAALCGIVGFKPTARRVPTEGAFPLSSTFDSVGPLAPSVKCCILLDQIMRGAPVQTLRPYPLKNLRVAIVSGLPLEHLDTHVSTAFERTVHMLQQSGVIVDEIRSDAIDHPDRSSSGARLLSAEAYATHRRLLDRSGHLYDPRVASRILPAAETTAADYIDLLSWRRNFVRDVTQELDSYDALLMPTTPIIAPPLLELEQSDKVYFETNTLMLRNTSIVNQMDGCALSLPCHLQDEPPVGLMVAGLPLQDDKILRIGLAIETLLNRK